MIVSVVVFNVQYPFQPSPLPLLQKKKKKKKKDNGETRLLEK